MMSAVMFTLISIVILVWTTSTLASAGEAAIFSVSNAKARAMVKAGVVGSKALLKIKEAMTKHISAIVIIDNIADIIGSALVGMVAADVLSSVALGIFFALFTIFAIIATKILPKTFGEAHADRVAPLVAPVVIVVAKAMAPVLWVIDALLAPFSRGSTSQVVSEEEIKIMTSMGRLGGSIEPDESAMIRQVFQLNDITAEDMMTPLTSIESIPGDLKLGDGRDRILSARHSRLPVIAEDGETVLGVVLTRDLIAALAKDRFDKVVLDYIQEAVTVAIDLPADDLLPLFQKREQHLGIVVDPAGAMVGVVSLEDVIEELVGEITDEKDVRPETIKRLSKTEIMVDEGTDIAKVNHFFNCAIAYEGTIGDYAAEKFGKHPRPNDSVPAGPLTLTVVSMTRTRPKLLKITKTG